MRGKEAVAMKPTVATGITPAYAGKRWLPVGLHKKVQDHPRVCGEKDVGIKKTIVEPGSPPRMRGKGNIGRPNITAIGITPAYAGKRRLSGGSWLYLRDHPRVCGEKQAVAADQDLNPGSPPRMRGKD